MRIDVDAGDPRRRGFDVEPELLVQFARERLRRRLVRLELAAGELPIAAVDLVRRPLREQDAPVRADEDGGGDVDDLRARADERPRLTAW